MLISVIRGLLLLFPLTGFCQDTPSIRIKKEYSQLYFFQVGDKTDTISRSKGDLFYLLIPDTLKDDIIIQVENGRLEKTKNDSTVILSYLPGISYESRYYREDKMANGPETLSPKPVYRLRTLINGAAALDKNYIQVKFIDKIKGEILMNKFFYQSASKKLIRSSSGILSLLNSHSVPAGRPCAALLRE